MGNLVVDEVVYISAERKDVIVFVNSVWVHLTALCFSVVVPVEIPRIASAYSIPKDKERERCPPKSYPDVTCA